MDKENLNHAKPPKSRLIRPSNPTSQPFLQDSSLSHSVPFAGASVLAGFENRSKARCCRRNPPGAIGFPGQSAGLISASPRQCADCKSLTVRGEGAIRFGVAKGVWNPDQPVAIKRSQRAQHLTEGRLIEDITPGSARSCSNWGWGVQIHRAVEKKSCLGKCRIIPWSWSLMPRRDLLISYYTIGQPLPWSTGFQYLP